jgi:hypothetical protein
MYELITKYKNEEVTSYMILESIKDLAGECEMIRLRGYEYCKLIYTNDLDGRIQQIDVNVDTPYRSVEKIGGLTNGNS